MLDFLPVLGRLRKQWQRVKHIVRMTAEGNEATHIYTTGPPAKPKLNTCGLHSWRIATGDSCVQGLSYPDFGFLRLPLALVDGDGPKLL